MPKMRWSVTWLCQFLAPDPAYDLNLASYTSLPCRLPPSGPSLLYEALRPCAEWIHATLFSPIYASRQILAQPTSMSTL